MRTLLPCYNECAVLQNVRYLHATRARPNEFSSRLQYVKLTACLPDLSMLTCGWIVVLTILINVVLQTNSGCHALATIDETSRGCLPAPTHASP